VVGRNARAICHRKGFDVDRLQSFPSSRRSRGDVA
jgi:hypothetical protein